MADERLPRVSFDCNDGNRWEGYPLSSAELKRELGEDLAEGRRIIIFMDERDAIGGELYEVEATLRFDGDLWWATPVADA
jgi:hypothetical protein